MVLNFRGVSCVLRGVRKLRVRNPFKEVEDEDVNEDVDVDVDVDEEVEQDELEERENHLPSMKDLELRQRIKRLR